jgi:hypothetical protein
MVTATKVRCPRCQSDVQVHDARLADETTAWRARRLGRRYHDDDPPDARVGADSDQANDCPGRADPE